MKTLPKSIGTLVLVLFATLASGSAMAQHHGRGHGHGGNVRFGISLGFPIYAPGYYPAPYYAYPAPVYAYPRWWWDLPRHRYMSSRVAQQASAQAPRDWYYCEA